MVIRSWRRCVSWFIFGTAVVLGLIYRDKINCEEFNLASQMRLTLGLMALLGLQGLLAKKRWGCGPTKMVFPSHVGYFSISVFPFCGAEKSWEGASLGSMQ